MTQSRNHMTAAVTRRLTWVTVLAVGFGTFGLAWLGSGRADAQAPPPVQGTIALEGTMRKVYRAANVIIVATMDGVEHTYHFAKDLVVHGGKGSGPDALAGLDEGATVVVHYAPASGSAVEIDTVGPEGLKITEGVVAHIDRSRREITIRYANGKTETLRLTERAAAEAGPDLERATDSTKVIVYYSDEGGRKVAHYFKRVSS